MPMMLASPTAIRQLDAVSFRVDCVMAVCLSDGCLDRPFEHRFKAGRSLCARFSRPFRFALCQAHAFCRMALVLALGTPPAGEEVLPVL